MKITWQNREWSFEQDEVTLKQAMVVQLHTGMSIATWQKTLMDPESIDFLKCLVCVYWLMLCQDGQTVPIADVDFPISKYMEAFVDALTADLEAKGAAAEAAAAAAGPDPTQPAEGSPPSTAPRSPKAGKTGQPPEEVVATVS